MLNTLILKTVRKPTLLKIIDMFKRAPHEVGDAEFCIKCARRSHVHAPTPPPAARLRACRVPRPPRPYHRRRAVLHKCMHAAAHAAAPPLTRPRRGRSHAHAAADRPSACVQPNLSPSDTRRLLAARDARGRYDEMFEFLLRDAERPTYGDSPFA